MSMQNYKGFLVCLGLFLSVGLAQAECISFDPLCRAMHSLSNSLDCFEGSGVDCGSDAEELKTMQDSSKIARKRLLSKVAAKPEAVAQVNDHFDRLDQALEDLGKAGGDAALRKVALDSINEIRKSGHKLFK